MRSLGACATIGCAEGGDIGHALSRHCCAHFAEPDGTRGHSTMPAARRPGTETFRLEGTSLPIGSPRHATSRFTANGGLIQPQRPAVKTQPYRSPFEPNRRTVLACDKPTLAAATVSALGPSRTNTRETAMGHVPFRTSSYTSSALNAPFQDDASEITASREAVWNRLAPRTRTLFTTAVDDNASERNHTAFAHAHTFLTVEKEVLSETLSRSLSLSRSIRSVEPHRIFVHLLKPAPCIMRSSATSEWLIFVRPCSDVRAVMLTVDTATTTTLTTNSLKNLSF